MSKLEAVDRSLLRTLPAVRRQLLAWFHRNRAHWSWRTRRDPYSVWIAETMLQQTRLAVVERAYTRFLHRFPDLVALAAASEEEVLAAWAGLGYYNRARNLHRAARVLLEKGRSTFPNDLREALALPGVGRYTAAAVLSIAYGRPLAAVDANIRRVLQRCFGLSDTSQNKRAIERLAETLLARRRPGEWNEALMELGQRTCTAQQPGCSSCPLRQRCAWHSQGPSRALPRVHKRKQREKVAVRMYLVTDTQGRLLLERGTFPYLPYLWLPLSDPTGLPESLNLRLLPSVSLRHAIVHRTFSIKLYDVLLSSRAFERAHQTALRSGERRAFKRNELSTIPHSSLLTKALSAVEASSLSVRPPRGFPLQKVFA